jgi:chaperone modulatory protein CbpM
MVPAPEDWSGQRQSMGQQELAHACGLRIEEIDELVEYGSLVPVEGGEPGARFFGAGCVAALRSAARLRSAYDLDLFTLGLALDFLQRIEQLEQQVRWLQAHLPQHLHAPREGAGDWREPHA